MDLGLSLGAFHDFTLDEALEICRRLADRFHLTAVEINLQARPGPDMDWLRDVPEDKLRTFAAPFRHRGAHLPFVDLNLISTNTGIRDESLRQTQRAIEVAGRMGLTYVVVHASGFRPSFPWEKERPLWLDIFRQVGEWSGANGMVLCIENGARLVRLDRLLEIIEALDADRTRLCIDVGHAYQRLWGPRSIAARILPRLDRIWNGAFRIEKFMPFERYGSLAAFVREAGPWIHHFHLHDRKGQTDHIGLGEGAIDLEPLAPHLAEKPVILEIPRTSEEAFAKQIERALELVS
ncbi:MAG: sugar phosphate isomerase/epimerase [Candidatus Eisenbacteria sp.]|nr:sugar phosphate isomerase/epimerase [Candidatus Eisenbacteria bacterium]